MEKKCCKKNKKECEEESDKSDESDESVSVDSTSDSEDSEDTDINICDKEKKTEDSDTVSDSDDDSDSEINSESDDSDDENENFFEHSGVTNEGLGEMFHSVFIDNSGVTIAESLSSIALELHKLNNNIKKSYKNK